MTKFLTRPPKFRYATRSGDPHDRAKWPDATEVVLTRDGGVIRVIGVFETRRIAELVVDNINNHSEFQVR